MAKHRYLIGIGSNMRHNRFGAPRCVVAAAFDALDGHKLTLKAASPIVETAPLGPSRRRFANAAAIVASKLEPDALLQRLKKIERKFGRRGGLRWGARVLDLDIVLWQGGAWDDGDLTIPHPAFRDRAFVLVPAARIAADWRDPLSNLTVRQLTARLTRPRAARR